MEYEMEMRSALFASLTSQKEDFNYYTFQESLVGAKEYFGSKFSFNRYYNALGVTYYFENIDVELQLFTNHPNDNLESLRYIIAKNNFNMSVQNSKNNDNIRFFRRPCY